MEAEDYRERTAVFSLKPKWAELILTGRKTVEIRRTAPKHMLDRILIYDTGKHMVTGVVRVKGMASGYPLSIWEQYGEASKLTRDEYMGYAGERTTMYAFTLAYPQRFAAAKNLSEYGIERAPQSWCYLPDPEPEQVNLPEFIEPDAPTPVEESPSWRVEDCMGIFTLQATTPGFVPPAEIGFQSDEDQHPQSVLLSADNLLELSRTADRLAGDRGLTRRLRDELRSRIDGETELEYDSQFHGDETPSEAYIAGMQAALEFLDVILEESK